MRKPLIGITMDSEGPGGYSKLPWYALRANYFDAVARQGALAIALPHEPAEAKTYADLIDGLVITGGAFDIDPALFGATTRHDTVTTKDRRTRFEWDVTEAILHQDKPVLGICGGQQLLNVVLGGTLVQHIPDEVEDALAHEQPNPRTEPGHDVKVETGTLLHRIVGQDQLSVNSAHHQAVRDVGKDVVIDARAPDGVIEGIESTRHRFCLGVQWHPEFDITDRDSAIFAAFVAAARA